MKLDSARLKYYASRINTIVTSSTLFLYSILSVGYDISVNWILDKFWLPIIQFILHSKAVLLDSHFSFNFKILECGLKTGGNFWPWESVQKQCAQNDAISTGILMLHVKVSALWRTRFDTISFKKLSNFCHWITTHQTKWM